jgi:hypothetical protein
MIEMQRTPARILKSRDLRAGEVPRPAAETLEPLDAAARATAPVPRPILPSAPIAAQPARCVAKEARVIASEGGAQAIEVRCSCGEWTRVELQTAASGEAR